MNETDEETIHDEWCPPSYHEQKRINKEDYLQEDDDDSSIAWLGYLFPEREYKRDSRSYDEKSLMIDITPSTFLLTLTALDHSISGLYH